MPLLRWDLDERGGLQLDFAVIEPQPGRTLQQHDPFVLACPGFSPGLRLR
jgi:hypothetical protein